MMKRLFSVIIYSLALLVVNPVHAGDGSCSQISRVCVDGPSTKIISGESVTRDCWRYEGVYQCTSATLQEDGCQELRDKGCGQVDATCVEYDAANPSRCIMYDKKLQCKVSDGVTQNVLDCGGQQFCANGQCFDTGATPDTDFAMAVTGMETIREAGNYLDPNSLKLFTGKGSKCSVKLFGLSSCCKKDTKGNGMNNSSLPAKIGVSAAVSIAGETVKMIGSNIMYETLFTGDGLASTVNGLATALSSGLDTSGFTPAIGYMGISVGFGALPATGMFGGAISGMQMGNFYVAFDPMSFAISIAIMVVMEMLACNEEEGILAMKRGASLCHSLGSYCDKKVLGACIIKKQSYCCYNSKLAKIINIAGRTQLGLGFGSKKNPDCSGFTADQLQKVDFSAIDFSEAFGEIQANIKTPTNAVNRATVNINSYFQ